MFELITALVIGISVVGVGIYRLFFEPDFRRNQRENSRGDGTGCSDASGCSGCGGCD